MRNLVVAIAASAFILSCQQGAQPVSQTLTDDKVKSTETVKETIDQKAIPFRSVNEDNYDADGTNMYMIFRSAKDDYKAMADELASHIKTPYSVFTVIYDDDLFELKAAAQLLGIAWKEMKPAEIEEAIDAKVNGANGLIVRLFTGKKPLNDNIGKDWSQEKTDDVATYRAWLEAALGGSSSSEVHVYVFSMDPERCRGCKIFGESATYAALKIRLAEMGIKAPIKYRLDDRKNTPHAAIEVARRLKIRTVPRVVIASGDLLQEWTETGSVDESKVAIINPLGNSSTRPKLKDYLDKVKELGQGSESAE